MKVLVQVELPEDFIEKKNISINDCFADVQLFTFDRNTGGSNVCKCLGCDVKAVPQLKNLDDILVESKYYESLGYNKCIKEIIGE